MDENQGGWTCMKCGHHVRPYPDDPEPEPDPYAVSPDPYAISPDLSLELDEARARIAELEGGLDANHNVIRELQGRVAALEAERDRLAGALKEIEGRADWLTSGACRDIARVALMGSGENDEHREMRP
jgi:uncharacterized coiled-coil protein SlyX